jgi:hypothetical protein
VRAAVVAHGDSAPVFDFSEVAFYLVTFFVERPVLFVPDLAVLLRRDAGGNALCSQRLAEPVAVVAPIPGQGLGIRQGVEHELCALVIAHLPSLSNKIRGLPSSPRFAQGQTHTGDKLLRQANTRRTNLP